jgi:hypothetical protein
MMAERRPYFRVELSALVAILLLAALRVINIDGPSLWIDEGFTYYTFKTDLFAALRADRHPPFYFYSLHAWEAFTGTSLLALRYWSFLPGMISVAALYRIGRELARGQPSWARHGVIGVPVLAALMMALADGENYLAQELRMYTWQVLFCALSLWFYLRWRRRDRWPDAAAWWAFMTLALYTHYFSLYVIAAIGLHALITLPARRKAAAMGVIALVGLAFAPWVVAVARDQITAGETCLGCGNRLNREAILSFRKSWLGDQWPLMLAIALFGLVNVRRRSIVPWDQAGLLCLLLVIIPLAATYIIGHDFLTVFNHHLAQITIPVALLIALGLGNLAHRPARVALVIAIVLYSVTTIDWYRRKAPWEELVRQIVPYAESDHLALAEIGAEESALVYYFDHLLPELPNSAYPWWSGMPISDYYDGLLPAAIAALPEPAPDDPATIWFVYWNAGTAMRDRIASAGYVPTLTFTVTHLDNTLPAYRYDRLADGALAEFDNGLILRAAEINADDRRVDLWWSAHAPTAGEYVTSVIALDPSGGVVAQRDTPPQSGIGAVGVRPTHAWEPGAVIYDPKWLELAPGVDSLPPGELRIAVQVYRFVDGAIERSPTIDGQDYAVIGIMAEGGSR